MSSHESSSAIVSYADIEDGASAVADAYYRWTTAAPGSRQQELAHADLIDSAAELRLVLLGGEAE